MPASSDPRAALKTAIMLGQMDELQRLSGEVAASSTTSEDPVSPLRFAVRSGQVEMARWLLGHGGDPHEALEDLREDGSPGLDHGRTLLMEAAEHDGEPGAQLVDLLIDHGADPDARDAAGATALLVAARRAAGLRSFERSTQEALSAVERGLSAVLSAAVRPEGRPAPAFQQLLSRGADPSLGDDTGDLPLTAVLQRGDAELAELLRRHGAAERGVDDAALLNATRELDVDAARQALAAGADPNTRLGGEGPPLVWAASADCPELVDLLLDAGADPNLAETGPGRGFTPLLMATYRGRLDLIDRLLAAGADPLQEGQRLFDYAKTGQAEGHHPEQPWDQVLARVRAIAQVGDSRIALTEPTAVAVAVDLLQKLQSRHPELRQLELRALELGDIVLLESAATDRAVALAVELGALASELGWRAVASSRGLVEIEPERQLILDELAAIDPQAAAASIATELDGWRAVEREELAQYGEEADRPLEALRRSVCPPPLARQPSFGRGVDRLVLVRGSAAPLPVLYRCGGSEAPQPDELASILSHWEQTYGAHLVGSCFPSLYLRVERSLDEAMMRAAAAEIAVVCPESSEEPEELLAMTASPWWSLWWD